MWQRIVTGLQTRADAAGLITWDVSVDSTIARAHQHAAGARTRPELQKEPPGGVEDEPADHALGRSRGGWTTKLHLACEQGRKPLSMLVTGGQRGDSPQFTRVLTRIRVPRPDGGRPRTRPDRVLADKAYSSRANREHLRRRGIPATIPIKIDQAASRRKKGSKGGRPPTFDAHIYQQRHAVECVINRLTRKSVKEWAGGSTRRSVSGAGCGRLTPLSESRPTGATDTFDAGVVSRQRRQPGTRVVLL